MHYYSIVDKECAIRTKRKKKKYFDTHDEIRHTNTHIRTAYPYNYVHIQWQRCELFYQNTSVMYLWTIGREVKCLHTTLLWTKNYSEQTTQCQFKWLYFVRLFCAHSLTTFRWLFRLRPFQLLGFFFSFFFIYCFWCLILLRYMDGTRM